MRERNPDSSSSCEREEKLFIDFSMLKIIFYFLYNSFKGSKTDSCNVVNMSNFFSLYFASATFQFIRINNDGLKCLLFWSPFHFSIPQSIHNSRVCPQGMFRPQMSLSIRNSQFQCLLHFDFLFFSPSQI
jgi:hypothetical protein